MSRLLLSPTGELEPTTAEQLAGLDLDQTILVLVKGQVEDGRPFYAYLAIRPSRYLDLLGCIKQAGLVSIFEHGSLILGDFQAEPPDAIKQQMAKDYGFDESYQEQLLQALLAERTRLLAQQEQERIEAIVRQLQTQAPDKPDESAVS